MLAMEPRGRLDRPTEPLDEAGLACAARGAARNRAHRQTTDLSHAPRPPPGAACQKNASSATVAEQW